MKVKRKKREIKPFLDEAARLLMIVAAALLMSFNMQSFVRSGGLIPGGFAGLTRLIQEICLLVWGVEPPYSLINYALSAIPVFIAFRFVGKKFALYSCLMIFLTGIFIDLVPGYVFTTDPLLGAVFGGLVNAIAASICLMANATAGGTDIIAIFLSKRRGVDSWNFILVGNAVLLLIAGGIFGWEKALYSIIFQFASTQVLQSLYKRYQKQTLFIVTNQPEVLYRGIREITNHDATLIKGVGCYQNEEREILYSVVGRDEVRKVMKFVRENDPHAFVNMIRTEGLSGRFYQRPNE